MTVPPRVGNTQFIRGFTVDGKQPFPQSLSCRLPISPAEKIHFVSIVEHFPEIWDYRSPMYKDNVRKIKAWKEIVREMESCFHKKFNEAELVRIWKNLRDSYRRKRREQYLSQGSGSGGHLTQQPWPYLEPMSYLSSTYEQGARSSVLYDMAEEDGSVTSIGDVELDQDEIVALEQPAPIRPSTARANLKKSASATTGVVSEMTDILQTHLNKEANRFDQLGAYLSSRLKALHAVHPKAAEKFQVAADELIVAISKALADVTCSK